MCFRLKLDHHVPAKCQTRLWLENQQWTENMVGVCLQGPKNTAHLFTLRITWELAQGPVVPAYFLTGIFVSLCGLKICIWPRVS